MVRIEWTTHAIGLEWDTYINRLLSTVISVEIKAIAHLDGTGIRGYMSLEMW